MRGPQLETQPTEYNNNNDASRDENKDLKVRDTNSRDELHYVTTIT